VLVHKGRCRTIYAYRGVDGQAPALQFLGSLPEEVRARYVLHFKDMCENGQVGGKFGHTLASKNHKDCRGLGEFKDNQSQTRVLYFTEGSPGALMLSHGFGGKKEDQLSETEIARAKRTRDEYATRKPAAFARARNALVRTSGGRKAR
jgi:hypothetical protein